MSHPKAEWAPTVLRVVMGVTLLFAAYSKFQNPQAFISMMKVMKVLPENLAAVYGTLLPYAELVVGLLLIFGLFTRIAAAVAALMFVSFIIGVGIANIKNVTFLMDPGAPIPNKDFGYLAMMISLFLLGPGRLALDHKWRKHSS